MFTLRGKTYVFQVPVTSAANAGAVTLATIMEQACLIKSVVIKGVTAAQTDLTSCAVTGGTAAGVANKVILVAVGTAIKASVDEVDEQVSGTGAWEIGTTKTIVMTLAGTGATAVNLLVTIEYVPCNNGGYLI